MKGSGRGHGRPRPEVSEQPDRLSGCSYTIGGSQGPPQPEPFTRIASPSSSRRYNKYIAPLDTLYLKQDAGEGWQRFSGLDLVPEKLGMKFFFLFISN